MCAREIAYALIWILVDIVPVVIKVTKEIRILIQVVMIFGDPKWDEEIVWVLSKAFPDCEIGRVRKIAPGGENRNGTPPITTCEAIKKDGQRLEFRINQEGAKELVVLGLCKLSQTGTNG